MKGITEILKNLRKIRSEMEGLELLIEDISKTTVTDVVSGSSCEFPYTARRFSITGVDMERLNEVTLKLVKKRSEYAAQLEQAERFLEDVPDPEMRNILRLRYELGMSWVKIGFKCDSTESAVRMKAERFLNKMEQCATCSFERC